MRPRCILATLEPGETSTEGDVSVCLSKPRGERADGL